MAKLEANSVKTGGKITIADTSGNLAFHAGLNTSGHGAACIATSKGPLCL